MLLLLMATAMPLIADDNSNTGSGNTEGSFGGGYDHEATLRAERDRYRRERDELQRQIDEAGDGTIRLISPQNITLTPGETREVTVTLRNVGSQQVTNLFSLASPSADAPFIVEFLRNSNNISQVGANTQRNMTLQISVNADADAGNHSITLDHYFRDDVGRTTSSTDTIRVRIEDEAGEAIVRMSGFQTSHAGSLSYSQTFTINVNLQNLGDATARDVRVSLPENMRAEDNIFITSDLNLAMIHAMTAGHSSPLAFTFQTSPDIATGAHTIVFSVSFRQEGNDERFTEVFPFVVNVYVPDEDEDDENLSTLEIRNMTAPLSRVLVGQNGVISFYLYNSSETEARNIRVEASPENGQSIVPMTANMQSIMSLAPGESRRLSFAFSPRDTAVTRSYAIRFRTTFEHGRGGVSETFEQFAAFNVYNPDEEDDDDDAARQIPRVMVSAHSLYPALPRAGHEFELTITFKNTSATRSVNNIRILLEETMTQNMPGQGQGQQHFAGFSPVDGSNTLFIDFLAPLAEVTKVLRFTTAGEATSGAHTKRISFDYQDQDFRQHEATQQISISVAQVTRLEIMNVEIMPFSQVGIPTRFSIRVINSGRVNLGNVRVRTEGPFDVTHAGGEEGEFIGEIRLQRLFDFHGQFVPEEPGMHEGVIVVTGEDPTGTVVEARHHFMVNIEGGFDFGGDFEGGDFPSAWDDGFAIGRPMPPGRPGDGMMHFPGDGMGMDVWGEEPDEPGFVTRIFTREVAVAPEWWDEEFDGQFNADIAAMRGIPLERRVNLVVVGIAAAIVVALIAIPVIIVLSMKRSKIDFDDED